MRAWAHIGISRNRDRVQEMLEAKPDSPLITGLFSALASAFGIGSKGGGASLTCVQNEVRGKLTLYSYQGPDVDGNDNLQRIVFDLQEAQRREKEKDDSPWTRPYKYAAARTCAGRPA